ncbi:MAG: 50S ribosome-binding GTPase [gamma proteobacterium symbiont of Lucinoma myriamae]|nr:50S ribosome-binding GTPase [gamma proteobacterium symbiont of Lucinoma myriamae]MCU7818828.1 50S ribosome-binding GTPase [gamma proteobacterium symbiont of Lucinoma myriamae]MCU7832020.1 50S ribosome-binding GTPase [gamma proteobacterium symbiont of Lucinoma myriamae]
MPKLPASRLVISIVLLLLFFIFLVAVLFVTNLSFSVWQQLQQKPDWLIWTYVSAIVLISVLFGRIIWRFLLPEKRAAAKEKQARAINDDMEATAQRLNAMSQKFLESGHSTQHSQEQEIKIPPLKQSEQEEKAIKSTDKASETSAKIDEAMINKWSSEFAVSPERAAIKAELKNYTQRKSQQKLYIALFGDISSGKSSVIKALIADSSNLQEKALQNTNLQEKSSQGQEPIIETSVIGGTTREIKHYHWHIINDGIEQHYILTDMPGLNEQYAELDLLATDEVQRAHIAIYLCDGDLSATQFSELKMLLLQKPCLVVLNKADRYSQEELQLISERIKQRIIDISPVPEPLFVQDTPVLTINAGGLREFIRLTPDGEEERVQRSMPLEVDVLREQLLKMMHSYGIDRLEQLREKSVAQMVNTKLDDIEAHFKHSQSCRMVKSYTKKAVVASMATISPGTDLLVQGYLGIQMVKDLCKLYEVAATDIDANKLIELIQSRMDKTLPLLLAIAGNGLKAFPGIGTVSGGLMHAVAYGMIFDTLGHSVARTLEVTGELSPALISDLYKEQLGENIESRTKDFIKLVLKLRNSD